MKSFKRFLNDNAISVAVLLISLPIIYSVAKNKRLHGSRAKHQKFFVFARSLSSIAHNLIGSLLAIVSSKDVTLPVSEYVRSYASLLLLFSYPTYNLAKRASRPYALIDSSFFANLYDFIFGYKFTKLVLYLLNKNSDEIDLTKNQKIVLAVFTAVYLLAILFFLR